MNKEELGKILIKLGVEPRNYTLNGPPYKDSSWVLESKFNLMKFSNIWSVFNFERGVIYDKKSFDTEDEACNYIYQKLKKHQELFNRFKAKN